MKYLLILLGLMIPFAAPWAGENCKSLVVVGMEDERSIAAGDDVEVVVGAANAAVLRERLNAVDISNIKAVFSFGVAGGVNPALKPGDLLLSTQVLSQSLSDQGNLIEESWMADNSMLVAATMHRAKNPDITFHKSVFLGSDFEARDNPHTNNKNLHEITGADIIDNESHIAAKFANEHNLPFMAIRAVSDSVNHPLPPAALLPLDHDGSPDGLAITKSLLFNPLQIPDFFRTAWHYSKAIRSLKKFRAEIGFSALTAGSQFQCYN
jgi:adenosylhomocysteine nucleosidase